MKRYNNNNNVNTRQTKPNIVHNRNVQGAYVPNNPLFTNKKRSSVTEVHNNQSFDLLDTNNSLPADFFNVNPNQETVSSVDGKVVDNFSHSDPQMFGPINRQPENNPIYNSNVQQNDVLNISEQELDVVSELYELSGNEYLLFVNGEMVCSGPKESIQEEVEALIYGSHELCDGINIPPDQVCVVKKVLIKVGAFLD